MNNTPAPQAQKVPAKSPKGSVTGFIISILALISAAIGSGLVHAHYTPTPSTTSKTGDALVSGTGHVISSLIGVPFLVAGISLAIVAALFVVVRFRKKLKAGSIIFSIVSLLICVWSFTLAADAFNLIKAH